MTELTSDTGTVSSATPDSPQGTTPGATAPGSTENRPWRSIIATSEVDTRLLGLAVALVAIWIGFNILSGGDFITSRNLWNLSVQSASIAVMATGMVLIIVSRNIDLSVGSLLGFLGYFMAMLQWRWIPETFGLGLGRPYTWVVVLAAGMALGALIGAVQGFIVAYVRVPAFIVSLGGYLVWRGLIFRLGAKGQTIAPLDNNFRLLGGGPGGSLGEWKSWILGLAGCAAIALNLVLSRNRRRKYDLAVRPIGVDIGFGVLGCGVVIVGIAFVANRYRSPITHLPTGIAYPGRHRDRGDSADDVPGPAAEVRALRLRVRRQPGGGRTRWCQHTPHGDVHVRRHGCSLFDQCGDPDRTAQRSDDQPRCAE